MAKAINFEANSKILDDLVYEKYLDLAMVYYIRQMVREVNRTTVVAEELLSNSVYVYDDGSKSVRIA